MPCPALKNDLLLRALRRQPVPRTPVWIMRQAGRYLPEYRELRARAGSFMALCTTPELACEAALQPLRRFPLDAAILFSDILTIPDAMGLGLHFADGEGPQFTKPLRSEADIDRLKAVDTPAQLGYVPATVRLLRQELAGSVPLIGFAGSPWTLATYMVEGGTSRDFRQIKSLLYANPAALHRLLAVLAQSVADYLGAQIHAGAQAIQIFDTWGGVLSHAAFQEFSLRYMREIIAALKADPDTAGAPIILFTKGGGQWLEPLAASGCDAVGLDWATDLGAAQAQVGGQVALQGNMDPAVLRAPPERIRREVAQILGSIQGRSGHVFNLGHGIPPDVPVENVAAFIDAVREASK
ncbi:MAG: uroporphyrinogen decarboxylase [Cellvibrionales bacterium]|nr:uroporphyrinogen decarboxylase [Cellvibrionales bacterium]